MISNTISRLVTVKPGELTALLISCGYFYLVLCAYYIIRPIRSEMAIANGAANIPWLMLLTLGVLLAITPLFGWVTTRFRTRQFLAYCSIFFASHLVIFYFLFAVEERSIFTTRAFFVWVNAFNMFIVSLFWSFMNDVYSRAQATRLFAFIAAGGTAGAISGPLITTNLVASLGIAPLLLISAGVLCLSVVCITWLTRWENPNYADESTTSAKVERQRGALEGGVMDGIKLIFQSKYLAGICLFIVLYAMSITFVEIQQAQLIEANIDDPTERTQLFSKVDLAVNVLALLFQLFITSRIIAWLGYRFTLTLIPLGITVGFIAMAFAPLLVVMIGVEIFRRTGDYSIMKPAREMLFSVVSREEKYKAKNVIDTVVLRGGNTLSALFYKAVTAFGAFGAGLAGIGIALGVAWTGVAYWLGTQYEKKRLSEPNNNYD